MDSVGWDAAKIRSRQSRMGCDKIGWDGICRNGKSGPTLITKLWTARPLAQPIFLTATPPNELPT